MRKHFLTAVLALMAATAACQTTTILSETENGYVSVTETVTTCTIHREPDTIVMLSDSYLFREEDWSALQDKYKATGYYEIVADMVNTFSYEIVAMDDHSARLRKTSVTTLAVQYPNRKPRQVTGTKSSR